MAPGPGDVAAPRRPSAGSHRLRAVGCTLVSISALTAAILIATLVTSG
jgi:hypothetical protein